MRAVASGLLLVYASLLADTINLKSRPALRGEIVGGNATTLQIQTPSGTRSVPITEVQSIAFDTVSPEPDQAAAPTPARQPASPTTQEIEGYLITLYGCTRHATESVACTFTATNLHADRQIGLGQLYEVDSQGNQQQAVQSSLSSQRAVYNTPVSGKVVFGGVTPDVTSIAKLSLSFSSSGPSGNANFEVAFRNVPLRGA